MFGLGVTELIIIFVIALVVFGPKRLPELGKALGKAIAQFKRASDEVKESIENEVRSAGKAVEGDKIKAELEGAGREKTGAAEGKGETARADASEETTGDGNGKS